MNDIDALYAAICQAPCEDAPRLIYADALQERDGPGDSLRAEFIRKSIELSQLGSPRITIDNAILQERGENYFELFANEQDGDFEVGQRIDVSGEEIDHIRHKSKNKSYPGLLITKVIPDDDFDETGSLTLALKQDEFSVPFPKKRHAELAKYVNAAIYEHWRQWIPRINFANWNSPQAGPTKHCSMICVPWLRTLLGAQFPLWEFNRGFVSGVRCDWNHWSLTADILVGHVPFTHVAFHDAPDFDHDQLGVTIAGQLLPWSYATSPGFGESYDDWVEEKLSTFLSLRWPTIPPGNWTLPD